MEKWLKRLWDIGCDDESKAKVRIERIKEISNELNEKEGVFLARLSKKDKLAFDEIISKYYDLINLLILDAYSKGIRSNKK